VPVGPHEPDQRINQVGTLLRSTGRVLRYDQQQRLRNHFISPWPAHEALAGAEAAPRPGQLGQAILTDTVLHGAMRPVFSLSRHSRADTDSPETPVTFVVMTLEADCPGDTSPGSQ